LFYVLFFSCIVYIMSGCYYITTAAGITTDLNNIFKSYTGTTTGFSTYYKSPSTRNYLFELLDPNETFGKINHTINYTSTNFTALSDKYRASYTNYPATNVDASRTLNEQYNTQYTVNPYIGCSNVDIIAIGGGSSGANSGVYSQGDGAHGGGGGCVIFNYKFPNVTTSSTINAITLNVGAGGRAGNDSAYKSNSNNYYNQNNLYFSGSPTNNENEIGSDTKITINSVLVATAGGGGNATSGTSAGGAATINNSTNVRYCTGFSSKTFVGVAGDYSYPGASGWMQSVYGRYGTRIIAGVSYYTQDWTDNQWLSSSSPVMAGYRLQHGQNYNGFTGGSNSGPSSTSGSGPFGYGGYGGARRYEDPMSNTRGFVVAYNQSGPWFGPGSAGGPGTVVVFFRYD